MGEGPIPVTAIIDYGLAYGCDDDLLQELIHYVQHLDGVYMKKQEAKAKVNKAKPARKGRR